MMVDARQLRSIRDANSQCLRVQLQLFNRCAPCRRQANDKSEIRIPCKMLRPLLLTRVKQRNAFTGHRVNCIYIGIFAIVAALTCQRQIIQRVAAAASTRKNMFNRKRIGRKSGLAEAVFTTILRACRNQRLIVGRNARFRHTQAE